MRVRAFGGICNRLRVVLSYRATFGAIEVGWMPDGEIANARFEDVFQALPGVRFEEGSDYTTTTLDPYPHAPADWMMSYRDLQLLPEHAARFDAVRPRGPYSAMHVRRTDHVGLANRCGSYTSDEQFLTFIREAPSPIVLCTDNGTTQLQFMRAIREAGKDCVALDGIRVHDKENDNFQRNTTLADAAIDLFLLAGATHLKLSGASSFSNTAFGLQQIRGWWS